MATSPQPSSILAETYHSILQTSLYEGKAAVIKSCRNCHDPRTKARWKNEVEALKLVETHPNITLLFNANASNLTITLRLEPGTSLDTLVDVQGRCTLVASASNLSTPLGTEASTPPHRAPLRLQSQITSALAHIHARGLVHDDVKPENIIWDPTRQRAVLVDFGATLHVNSINSPSSAYVFNPSGTPSYAPPEFLHKTKGLTGKGDIWALGVTMLFVWGYVRLPDGAWLLPGVWDEPSRGHREEMQQWLLHVRMLRDGSAGEQRPELRTMLADDPGERIGSADLELRLSLAHAQLR